jgi:hypothetical protein
MYPFARPMCIIEKENLQFHTEGITKDYKGEKSLKNDSRTLKESGIPVSKAAMSFEHILHPFPHLPEIPQIIYL